jgi:hypothetical protein
MKKILYFFIVPFIISCASSQQGKVDALELKLDKLTKLLEDKPEKPESKENVEEVKKIESPTIVLEIPKVKKSQSNSMKRKISLGIKNNIKFDLLFDTHSYWVVLTSENKNVSLDGVITMGISHEDKSPESHNFFKIRDGVYQSYGENLKGKVEFEIIFAQGNKKPIGFIVEAEL